MTVTVPGWPSDRQPGWSPAPEVFYQPVTVVTTTAKELLAELLLQVPMYGALHTAQPDPADASATMLARQWVYWEPLVLARDGSVLWNTVPVEFVGVVGTADELWLAVSDDNLGDRVLFAGRLEEYDRALSADGSSRTVVVPTGSIRLSIA